MRDSKMLFKHPGHYKFDGEWFDYVVVHKDAVPAYLERGWSKTLKEALEAAQAKPETSKQKRFNELTGDEIHQIAMAEGSFRQLAKQFNVSIYSVRKIKNGAI